MMQFNRMEKAVITTWVIGLLLTLGFWVGVGFVVFKILHHFGIL